MLKSKKSIDNSVQYWHNTYTPAKWSNPQGTEIRLSLFNLSADRSPYPMGNGLSRLKTIIPVLAYSVKYRYHSWKESIYTL